MHVHTHNITNTYICMNKIIYKHSRCTHIVHVHDDINEPLLVLVMHSLYHIYMQVYVHTQQFESKLHSNTHTASVIIIATTSNDLISASLKLDTCHTTLQSSLVSTKKMKPKLLGVS